VSGNHGAVREIDVAPDVVISADATDQRGNPRPRGPASITVSLRSDMQPPLKLVAPLLSSDTTNPMSPFATMTRQLLAIAERLIDAEALPAAPPDAVYGGTSQGKVCALCGECITVHSAEIELVWEQLLPQRTVHMHPPCFAAYRGAREGSTR